MQGSSLASAIAQRRRNGAKASVRLAFVGGISFIAILSWVATCATEASDAQRVRKLIRPGLDSVQTIESKFKYVVRTELSSEDFWGLARTVPGLRGSQRALIASDGRWRIDDVNPNNFTSDLEASTPDQHASGQAIQSYYNKVAEKWEAVARTAPASLELFDGLAVWSSPPYGLTSGEKERNVYRKRRPEDLEPGILSSSPLPDQLFLLGWDLSRMRGAFPDAAVLPESLREEGLTPIGTHLVDGEALAVFKTTGGSDLYLDKKLGYALRKKVGYFSGEPVQEVVASDFEQVVQGVWLPRKVHVTQLGHKQFHPLAFHGKPLWHTEYFDGEWTVNSPRHKSLLAVVATPGSWVIDATIETGEETVTDEFSGAEIKSQVAYLQPADESTLEAVIENAKERHRALAVSQGSRILKYGNQIGAVVLIISLTAIGATFWWRSGPILPSKRRTP